MHLTALALDAFSSTQLSLAPLAASYRVGFHSCDRRACALLYCRAAVHCFQIVTMLYVHITYRHCIAHSDEDYTTRSKLVQRHQNGSDTPVYGVHYILHHGRTGLFQTDLRQLLQSYRWVLSYAPIDLHHNGLSFASKALLGAQHHFCLWNCL